MDKLRTRSRHGKPIALPLIISLLMLGMLACVCGPLSNVFPGGEVEPEEEVTIIEPEEEEVAPAEEEEAEEPAEAEEEAPPGGAITVDNARDVEMVNEFQVTEGASFEMKVAPSGEELAVFGFDGLIRFFDVETGDETTTLSGHASLGWGMAFSPDGTLLASGDEGFRLFMWDLESGDELFNIVADTDPGDMTFTPDGEKLVLIGFNSSKVFIFDPDGRELGQITEHGRVLTGVDVSPDGQYIASGNARGNVVISEVDTLETVTSMNEGTGSLWGTKFSPDGTKLAACSGSGDVWVWETESWKLTDTWLAHSGGAQYCDWSRDGSVLVTVGTDNRTTMWDPDGGHELKSFETHDGAVWKVDFAPDGSFFATLSGAEEAFVRIFSLP